MRGVRQVLRQLVRAEGAHADARRPPVQVQGGDSIDISNLGHNLEVIFGQFIYLVVWTFKRALFG